MKQQELLRQLVLSEISDDYEEPKHVYENVARKAAACGIPASRPSVERILLELVEQGLANAYDLRGHAVVELASAPRLKEIYESYFWISANGLATLLAFREAEKWPFDCEDELIADWSPPPD